MRRRLLLSITAAAVLPLVGAGAASAAPAPDAGAAKEVPGTKVCKIEDRLLNELSGLVATKNGYIVTNDSTDSDEHRKIFFLTKKCKIDDRQSFPTRPRDIEDLALSADGKTLWIADIGDNITATERRASVALWTMPADGSKKPVIHRVAYDDGKHDAEALLLNGDGTPVIVTKDLGKTAVYVPTGPLKADNTDPVKLRKAAEITIPASTTSTPLAFARTMVTGGAVSPDGSKVVLRTYSDAFEWDVKNGDVVAALQGKPRMTPLPDEPGGEAIAYTPDGKEFLTVSDLSGRTQEENHILRYTPATTVVTASTKNTTGATPKAVETSWFSGLSLSDITWLIGGVGILGLILVGFGIAGIMRARRRRTAEPPPARPVGGPAAQTTVLDAPELAPGFPPTAPARGATLRPSGSRGGVYGGARPAAPAPPGGVYGIQPSSAPESGGVYGGPPPADPRPGVYGGRSARASARPPASPGVYGAAAHPGGDDDDGHLTPHRGRPRHPEHPGY